MKELLRLLGIRGVLSTAYHLQTDGQTKWCNQELETYLWIFINEQQDDWDKLLPMAEFAYNNHVHSATQHTPFLLDTGRHLRMGFEPEMELNQNEVAQELVKRMKSMLEEAKAALRKSKEEMTWYYNQRRELALELWLGDEVFLDLLDIQIN